MASIYRILISDFGVLKQQIKKGHDSILLPVIPRVGDFIRYFYTPDSNGDESEEIIDIKVTSVKLYCQEDSDNFDIPLGQESQFWDNGFSHHAEIEVDRAD